MANLDYGTTIMKMNKADMNNKIKMFDKLMEDMKSCNKCVSTDKDSNDKSLVNIYRDLEFAKKIPSIWTDWYNRLDSKIMIIGQDWGPQIEMKKINDMYLKNETKSNWKKLIEVEASLTKKQLTKFMIESSKGKINSIDDIYITNAIMCARQGDKYRSDNINLKQSTSNCQDYLLRQIEIVNPKLILTLGYYPILSLSKIFGFTIQKTMKDIIQETPIIKVYDYIIIPLYHPAAQIKKEEQIKQYMRIWNYI